MLAYVPGDSDAVTKLMEEAFVTLRRQTNSPVDRDYGLSLLPLKTVEDLQDYYETITYPASFADGTKLYAGIVFDDKSVKSLEEGSFGDTRFQVIDAFMRLRTHPLLTTNHKTPFWWLRRTTHCDCTPANWKTSCLYSRTSGDEEHSSSCTITRRLVQLQQSHV